MIPATFVGMALAIGSLVATMLLEGTSPLSVVLLPPLLLVFGATLGAVVAGSTTADVRRLGSWFRMAFAAERPSTTGSLVAQLVDALTDHELGAVVEDHRGVATGLDPLDGVGVDGEVLTVATGDSDHGSGPSARSG